MNIHKGCVKVIEESCIGALHRKERGNDRISKIVDRFRPGERDPKRKLTTQGTRLVLCFEFIVLFGNLSMKQVKWVWATHAAEWKREEPYKNLYSKSTWAFILYQWRLVDVNLI